MTPAQTNITHVPTNYNISFTLAKLVPGTNGEPSRWVNYLVTKLAATSTPGLRSGGQCGRVLYRPIPQRRQQGTLVDNGDGTYQYTFLRDITQAQNIIKALPATYTVGSSTYNTADLDINNLNYDPTATHRLGILLTGSQPGTGAAVPGGVAPAGAIAVPLVYTFSLAYDFVPAGGAVVNTRNVVSAGSCDGCHDNVSQKRGLGHISVATASNGIPPGTYVGRNDPALCVACHTDQTKYGFAQVTSTTNADTSPAYTGAYYRTNPTISGLDQAAFTYPRMIHQTHMGNQLVLTGYNLNNHCTGNTLATNAAQCFNLVGLPQDQRNCTKCHDGSATKSDGSTNVNQTSEGDNWKNVPSQVACGSCHDGINFATGTGITLTDRDTDLAAKNPVGTTHSGHGNGVGPLTDNSKCTTCHTAGAIAIVHETPYPSLNSVGLQTGIDTVAYNIKSVTVNTLGQPVITFQILVNGTAVTSFNTPATVTNAKTGAVQADPNPTVLGGYPELVGGPSFYAAYAVPQDGIAAPSDFNVSASASLVNLLVASGSPKAGSITGPDSSGYFTATLIGDTVGQPVTATCLQNTGTSAITGNCVNPSPIAIPANAVMVTGAIIGGFDQKNLTAYPYTLANVLVNPNVSSSGGVGVSGQIAKMGASSCTQTGITAAQATKCTTPRRVITSAAKCNNCHDELGTDPAFHTVAGTTVGAGYRNDPTACNICHLANRTDSGWPVDSSTWMHGIHGASKRAVAFTAASTDFSTILFPGQLRDCSHCHLPNTVNFGAGSSAQGGGYYGGTLQPNLLWSYAATGKIATPAAATYAVTNPQLSKTTDPNSNTSPYVTVGTNYGNVFTFANAGAVLPSVTPSVGSATSPVVLAAASSVPADGAALVNSPISSACSACHADATAWAHMRNVGGGVLYGARSTSLVPNINAAGVLVSPEACLSCHGQGEIMDVAVVHKTQ